MDKDLTVPIEETFELPSWFKNWVEGIYQSPWQTDRPFDYLVKHVIENDFYNHWDWLGAHHYEAINYIIGYEMGQTNE